MIALLAIVSLAFASPIPLEQELVCNGDELVLRLVFDDDAARLFGDASSFGGWIGNAAGSQLVTFNRTGPGTLETEVSPTYFDAQDLGYTVEAFGVAGVVALDESAVNPGTCPLSTDGQQGAGSGGSSAGG